MTAMPVVDVIRIQRIFSGHDLVRGFCETWYPVIKSGGKQVHKLGVPNYDWRPILRAAQSGTDAADVIPMGRSMYRELHCDGLVEFGYVSDESRKFGSDGPFFPFRVDWFVDLFANLIIQLDRIRRQSGSPSVEYVVELEIIINGRNAVEESEDSNPHMQWRISLDPGKIRLPRYPLQGPEGFLSVLSQVEQDMWNFLGKDYGESCFIIEGWPNQV